MQPHDETDTARGRWLQQLLGRMEVDRAVLYALSLRIWQLAAGAVSVLLIATFFSRSQQGYWYTFFSLTALQAFFELGFSIVVVNVASHEWSRLRLDESGRIVGEAEALSRLVSLGRLLFRWYAAAGVLFAVVVGLAGYYFLAAGSGAALDWQTPWFAVVALSGLLLGTLPFVSLLEGCGQVTTVYRYRLMQAVVANVTVWTAVILGAGLWAAVAVTAARVLCELYLLGVRYRRFFAAFVRPPRSEQIGWREEVLPMQWRVAVGGVFHYFAGMFFTPVMFHYQGAVVAGQMGMTWTLMTALQMASLSWVQTRVPQFGVLIARREYRELDERFRRLTLVSLAAVTAGGALLWCVVYGLGHSGLELGNRLLPPPETALLIAAIVLGHVPQCFTYYLRAHRREPASLPVVAVASNLAIGLLVWLLGGYLGYGAAGAAAGYLAVVTFVTLPSVTAIFVRCRRAWHAKE